MIQWTFDNEERKILHNNIKWMRTAKISFVRVFECAAQAKFFFRSLDTFYLSVYLLDIKIGGKVCSELTLYAFWVEKYTN